MVFDRRRLLVLALLFSSCSPPASELTDLDFHRGRNALAMARFDWARHYFAADLEQNPGRPESWRGLGIGWASGAEGVPSKAIECFEKYLEAHPDDSDVRLRLAGVRYRLRELDSALSALEGLSDVADAQLQAARIELDRDPQAAAVWIERALETTPKKLATQTLAARIYARLGDDARAVSHAQRAAAIDPLHAEAYYLLGIGRRRLGQDEPARQALATYESLQQLASPGRSPSEQLSRLQALPRGPAPRPTRFHVRQAGLLLQNGRIEEAATTARQLIEDPAAGAEELFGLAQQAHARGRVLLARDLYAAILDREPSHLGALAQQAQLAYSSGDFAQAQDLLEIGSTQDAFYAPFHFLRGQIALAERRDEAAIDGLRAAIDLAPWLASYRIALADVFRARGDREAVMRLLAEAPTSDPILDAYRQQLAW